jgi:hypothetical protein
MIGVLENISGKAEVSILEEGFSHVTIESILGPECE